MNSNNYYLLTFLIKLKTVFSDLQEIVLETLQPVILIRSPTMSLFTTYLSVVNEATLCKPSPLLSTTLSRRTSKLPPMILLQCSGLVLILITMVCYFFLALLHFKLMFCKIIFKSFPIIQGLQFKYLKLPETYGFQNENYRLDAMLT